MRRRNRATEFPAPLTEFAESEWQRVPGECLDHYGCYGAGYAAPCSPRPGEYCGELHHESLQGRPELLARALRADAFTRWKLARCGWLGEGHPGWLEEFLASPGEREIRYRGA